MRIAMVVRRFPVVSETFVLNQITGLMDRGHEVDIYTLDQQEPDTTTVHQDVARYRLLERTVHALPMPRSYARRAGTALRLVRAEHGPRRRVLLRALDVVRHPRRCLSLRAVIRAVPFLDRAAYDVLHCQAGTVGEAVLPLWESGAARGRLVVSFRGRDVSSYVAHRGVHAYRRLLAKGDLFLPNCDHFRQRLLGLGAPAERTHVLRSGVDRTRFAYRAAASVPGPVRFLTTARFVEKKGLEYALRALAVVVRAHPDVEYHLVGDGPLRPEIEQLIERLRLTSHVHLHGWVTDQRLPAMVGAAHVFVAPSVRARDGDEDAPINTLKEAMAMGVPVVGTRHGGIPELVEDGVSGFLVPERDPDALADRLMYLIEHPERRREMGRAGRATVEARYDKEKLNDELVELYRRIAR